MESNPLVSIIIPVCNMEDYLAETMESVLATVYTPIEVIVVDDGSKDKTIDIANTYATNDNRVTVVSQKNAGVCVARNRAIRLAKGEFILPVDGDDLISPHFVSLAVEQILKDEKVTVVTPRSMNFGNKTGEWKLPQFSLSLLARKNIIAATALYRRSDWERVGGYCESLCAREDWDFWIAMLKDGGKVVRLSEITFYYRRRSGSKRIQDRAHNRHVIDMLNDRHGDFFLRELGGALNRHRSLSRLINTFTKILRK